MHVLVRDARAFSCAGSGVDDLRLVHAAGGGVGRLPDSTFTCVGLCPLLLCSQSCEAGGGSSCAGPVHRGPWRVI